MALQDVRQSAKLKDEIAALQVDFSKNARLPSSLGRCGVSSISLRFS